MRKFIPLVIVFLFSAFVILFVLPLAVANNYFADVSLFIPDGILVTNENITLKGIVTQSNYTDAGSLVASNAPAVSQNINVTINYKNGTFYANYTLTTDSSGKFYSRSQYSSTGVLINAPSSTGYYYLIAAYTDPNSTRWYSQIEFQVVNQSVDMLRVGTNKATYLGGDKVTIQAEAVKQVGDRFLFVSNVTVNGSIRNSSYSPIGNNFTCTTGTNGRCAVNVTASSTNGRYIVELENFKAVGSFYVVPFSYSVYMKDELGKSVKSVYALAEQASVEISVQNTSSDSDIYNFTGYIVDSSGNVVKMINNTLLNSNNSFVNTFTFTIDALTFSYGSYRTIVSVQKQNGAVVHTSASFEVKDWVLSFNKRAAGSGFEYENSAFPNKTLFFEVFPTYRTNGSIIPGINVTFFTIRLKDSLDNVVDTKNVTWNATCGKAGCYDFYLNASSLAGRYTLSVALAYSGSTQTKTQIVNVITGAMSAQSTDRDGATKDLFGTNEYVYLTLKSYNATVLSFNLSDAELFTINYMNGTELNYTQVANWTVVNATNNVSEWAWNITSQRLKFDVPKVGGLYTVNLFGNNRTLATSARFIVNPYDVCSSAKDTPGTVSSGNYYVYQFKKKDTIYFELKVLQANNPTGRAVAGNNSASNVSSAGLGSACIVDTTTRQAVTNATLSVLEVRNTESGVLQNINTTDTVCQATDSSGTYGCTVKPLTKWEGGVNSVTFRVLGLDGTQGIATARFEARSFYISGYTSTWQNNPQSNITLNVQLYEAGGNWWGSVGSGGLGGTVTVKKVEYMGRDGEWVWPPVSTDYNASALNSSSVTSGSGSISLPASFNTGGAWKTGNYRAILQATTTAGDTDYGYAWFGVKLFDVYGMPIECTAQGCSYKSYFNSKENITLYIKVSTAGDYSYSAQAGQTLNIGTGNKSVANITIGVKKIQDCRTWPCKELNASDYTATRITVNQSSPWYWNANINNQTEYILWINSTKGTWNTGYYSIVLDVNGTDTGYAWFNSIAFYVETQPVSNNGATYKSSVRGNQQMYFNISTVKAYKGGYYFNGTQYKYNTTDYVNSTLIGMSLRFWDQAAQKQVEYQYPTDLNITRLGVNGSGLLNVSYVNGTWPTAYYWGEATFRNADNEVSTGWLWFSVQPFRVQISTNTYSTDTDQCVNGTVTIYDPDWSSSNILRDHNYSIIGVTENSYSSGGSSLVTYTNFTTSNFNGTANVTFCPNSGEWGSGSWGGYHYITVLVKNNVTNETNTGWLSFRTIPFQISWGSVAGGTSTASNQNISVPVTLTASSSGASASGNLTSLYQWRYDTSTQYRSTREDYVFKVGNCWSNVSGQCNITGRQNISIYPPSTGWKVGYNYLQAEWTKATDANSKLQDWSGINFEGREAYNGYYDNIDANGNWKYYFNTTENITIKLRVRDSSYNNIAVNVTNVDYAASSSSCYSEWCRSYVSPGGTRWAVVSGDGRSTSASNGGVITISPPSGGWTKADYYIKATVSASAGTATVTGGMVKVKDFTPANITLSLPVNNVTYNATNLTLSATTTKSVQCSINVANHQNFYSWYCGGWNTTNSNGTVATPQTRGACNLTLYNYTGTSYYNEYISNNYRSSYNGTASVWGSGTYITTGSTSHTYTFNMTDWPKNQDYGLQLWCWDNEGNNANALAAVRYRT